MNQFNQNLDKARKQQRLIYILGAVGVLIVGLVVFAAILFSNGTRLVVEPEEAALGSQISVSKGMEIAGSVYSLSRAPIIHVSAEGYKPVEEQIPLANIGKTHLVQMQELPARLKVQTQSQSDQTKWMIDGKVVSIAAQLDQELKAGHYQISIDNPYFELEEFSLDLVRGQTLEKTLELKPVMVPVSLQSNPNGAEIEVNGKSMGETPLDIFLPGGAHTVLITSPIYKTIEDALEVKRSVKEISRNYQLSLKTGMLNVSLSPASSVLLVDGLQKDHRQSIEVSTIKQHKLVVSKPGYGTEVMEVSVKPGEVKDVAFNLKPMMGTVEVSANPKVEVWLNGQLEGHTPLKLELMAIPQKITLKKDGYRSISRTVTPTPASMQRISLNLDREEEARLKEAKAQYTNSLGQSFKLFHPNEQITIGAARSEKGQRANEFLRTLKLDRPFYAGLTEVTNQQFKSFMPSKAKGGGNEPVTNISWQEAAAFCNWLSQKEGLEPFYRMNANQVIGFNEGASGYRLLTEAEWEWLARKASKNKMSLFVWGNDTVIPPKAANIADESAKGSVKFYVPRYNDQFAAVAPVQSFNQEPSGLYDQAGNVSEWVHDVYSIVPPTSKEVMINPFGAKAGSTHVVKGANYRSGTLTELRPAFREGLAEGRGDIGFRIGRNP